MTSTSILTHLRPSGSCQSQPAPDPVLRKTVRQANFIGIFDVPTILNVYNRRLEAAAQAMRRAA